jgi:hypothetical protein
MSPIRIILTLLAACLLAVVTILAPQAAADGWRAAFLLLSAAPIGAIALLLIGRLTGAGWQPPLMPLLPLMPWLVPLAVPVVLGQALFHHPVAHLNFWLSWPMFVLRSAIALAFWIWVSRALLLEGPARPGVALAAHGVIVSVMAFDWILGASPAQPNSGIGMTMAAEQIGAACAVVCLLRLGTAAQRRDLSYLLIACALGVSYLLYMDFAIVWFGNLPDHVGWYVDRYALPAAAIPGLALAIGLFVPILLIAFLRDATGRAWAGAAALIALGLIADWQVAGEDGWLALVATLATTVLILLMIPREARRAHERA